MSPQQTEDEVDVPQNISKYTRGEKCIFYHVLVTLFLIVSLVIIYMIHLFVVPHDEDNNAFKTYRRSGDRSEILKFDIQKYQYVGVVYLDERTSRLICNTLLLKDNWSLAPAQCTSMRDDPDMVQYLPFWKIKYRFNGSDIVTDVQRTLTHFHFNRADYQNNIGLFKHISKIVMDHFYIGPNNFIQIEEIYSNSQTEMVVVNWDINYENTPIYYHVRSISEEMCKTYATPIVEQLRSYEFCVTFKRIGPTLDHGALFMTDSKIVGFFSWGDIQAKGVPLIILNITHFKNWFESMISFL